MKKKHAHVSAQGTHRLQSVARHKHKASLSFFMSKRAAAYAVADKPTDKTDTTDTADDSQQAAVADDLSSPAKRAKEMADAKNNKYVNVCFSSNHCSDVVVAMFCKDELPVLFSKAVDAVEEAAVRTGKTESIIVDSSNGYFDGLETLVGFEDACAILRKHNDEELEEKDDEDGEGCDDEYGEEDPSDYVNDNIDDYVEEFIVKVRDAETKFDKEGGRSVNGHVVCTIKIFQD